MVSPRIFLWFNSVLPQKIFYGIRLPSCIAFIKESKQPFICNVSKHCVYNTGNVDPPKYIEWNQAANYRYTVGVIQTQWQDNNAFKPWKRKYPPKQIEGNQTAIKHYNLQFGNKGAI